MTRFAWDLFHGVMFHSTGHEVQFGADAVAQCRTVSACRKKLEALEKRRKAQGKGVTGNNKSVQVTYHSLEFTSDHRCTVIRCAQVSLRWRGLISSVLQSAPQKRKTETDRHVSPLFFLGHQTSWRPFSACAAQCHGNLFQAAVSQS